MEWELQLTMQQLQGVKRRFSDLYPDLVESEASIYVRREGEREGGREGGRGMLTCSLTQGGSSNTADSFRCL